MSFGNTQNLYVRICFFGANTEKNFDLSFLKYVLNIFKLPICFISYRKSRCRTYLYLLKQLKNSKIIIMGAYNSKEEPSMEEPAAKRRRLELPNAEEIIQNQQQLIENLRAEIASKDKRILELEVHCPDWEQSLPNECLMKIMSYLSSYDLLRNVARVSKKFHELSQDQHLIRKIEVDSETWTKIQEGKYWEDFLKVLKRSLKLTFLSFIRY